MQGNGHPTVELTLKVNETKRCMTLAHSNGIICSPLNLFSTGKFPLFRKPDAAFPSPACREKGISQLTLKVNETKGCMTLAHSNWTICSPLNLFSTGNLPLFQKPDAAYPFPTCTFSAVQSQSPAQRRTRTPFPFQKRSDNKRNQLQVRNRLQTRNR